MYKFAIVEDNEAAAEKLAGFLERYHMIWVSFPIMSQVMCKMSIKMNLHNFWDMKYLTEDLTSAGI